MTDILKKYGELDIKIKATIWFTICNFISKGIRFLTDIFFAQLLSVSEYGNLSVFNAWNEILLTLVTLRLSAGVYQRGLLQYKSNKERFTLSLLKLSIIFIFIYFVIFHIFRDYISSFTELNKSLLYALLIEFIFLTANELWMSGQRFEYKYKMVVFVTLTANILSTAISVFAVYAVDRTAEVKIISQIIVSSFIYLWLFLYIIVCGYKKRNDKINNENRVYWKYALSFNIPLIPHYLSQTILNQSDRIMISHFVSKSAAGIYTVAYSMGMLVQILQNSLFLTLSPWRYQKMEDKKYEDIDKASRYILIFFSIILGIFVIIGPDIIVLFYPIDYQEAKYIIPPIGLASYFMFLYSFFGNIEFYFKKTKFTMISSTACAIINIWLNYIGINRFGYSACAYTTLLCYAIYSYAHYFTMNSMCMKIINCRIYNMKKINLIVLITLCSVIFIRFFYDYSYIRHIFLVLLIMVLINKRKALINLMYRKMI